MTENELIGSGRRHLQLSSVPISSTSPFAVTREGTQTSESCLTSRSAFFALIRSAVATLWSINDAAAALLMTRFYSEIGQGHSRADALRAAQMSLLADHRFAHPIYWSPFLMIGSWL